MKIISALLSGLLLAAAFPKFNMAVFAWFALIPLFLAIEQSKNPRASGFLGFLFGIVFFGINFFWVNTLSDYVGFFAILGWICLVIFQSLFTAVFAYFSKKLNIGSSIWQALLWIAIEIIRGLGSFGVPGGVVAYSQTAYLPLLQIASFASPYSVSFIVVLFNISIARLITKKGSALFISTTIVVIMALFYGAQELKTDIKHNKYINIAVIQGNIPQEKKLSSTYNFDNFNIHKELTAIAAQDAPDIVIWPETFIFTYLMDDKYFLNEIKTLAKRSNAHMIVGSPYYDRQKNLAYNSIIAFSKSGEVMGRYDKERLVPFGEYLPLRRLLYPFLQYTNFFGQDFSSGKNFLPLEIGGIKIGCLICFESTFSEIVKKRAKHADVLLVVTNDAWFKTSSAPYDHLNYGILRAIENRKYFIQCANTGLSAVIDPYGRILKKLNIFEQGVLIFKIPLP